MINQVQEFYGNRLRVRVCGVCCNDQGQLLLVNHRALSAGDFWIPPGGGVEFSESVVDCLKREFREETGLIIEVGEFLFTCEFIQPPLHAIELFFKVQVTDGILKTGHDPELKEVIIQDAKFISWKELAGWNPESLHGIFKKVSEPSKIVGLKGYFKL